MGLRSQIVLAELLAIAAIACGSSHDGSGADGKELDARAPVDAVAGDDAGSDGSPVGTAPNDAGVDATMPATDTPDAAGDVAVPDSSPTHPLLRGVTAISAGLGSTCALLSDGTVDCWGISKPGAVGPAGPDDGGVQTTSVVVTGVTGASSIVVGSEAACARISGGAVDCWGDNFGTTAVVTRSPMEVPGWSGATALGMNEFGNCAVSSGGTVTCMQETRDPGTDLRTGVAPVAVGGLTGVKAVTVGGSHACALLTDSTVKCWGADNDGQLGDDGTFTLGPVAPVAVKDLTGVAAVSAGWTHTCAVLSDKTVDCWGDNMYGEVGNSTEPTASIAPIAVSGVHNAVGVGTGVDFSCALLSDGTVECWGNNASGELGHGGGSMANFGGGPSAPVTGIAGATAIAVGWDHACALLGDGTVACWGANEDGQLGDGTTTARQTPVFVQ